MKFIFKNLGPIHEAELELGDLTILAGRNNTGKTYVAYTLYGFLKWWLHLPQFPEFFDELSKESLSSDDLVRVPNMERLVRTVKEKGQAKWPIDREELSRVQKAFMQKIARDFSAGSLPRVFSALPEDFEDASFRVVIEETFPKDVPSRTFRLHTGNEFTTNEFTIAYSGDEILYLRRSKASTADIRNIDVEAFAAFLSLWFLRFLFPDLPDPFILPAERFDTSLFYRELDFTKNRLVELLQEVGKDRDSSLPFQVISKITSRYALPIRDNIDYIRDIPYLQKHQSKLYDSKIFNDIRDMMGGFYRSSGDEIRFKSKARKDGFDIPLHLASSSARGLSDLYFFLRHVAQKGQLLIIDEPESHLDTANQIQFARLLAHAVNTGLKVLITTHSDYIVKEVNNLLMLSQDFEEKDEVLKKLKYSEHDYLKPESVRAYVAEKNSLTPCTIEKYGIDMPVFDTTIDKINRVSSELSVRLKYEGEG